MFKFVKIYDTFQNIILLKNTLFNLTVLSNKNTNILYWKDYIFVIYKSNFIKVISYNYLLNEL